MLAQASTRAHARPRLSAAWSALRTGSRSLQCQPKQQWDGRQQQQQRLLQLATKVAVSDDAAKVSYEWSWDPAASSLPEDDSLFGHQHPITANLSLQEGLDLVGAAAASEQAPSQRWLQQLMARIQPYIQQLQGTDACQLLQQLAQLDYTPTQQWMSAAVQQACTQLQQLSTQQLSGLMWSLGNLRHTPQQQHWQDTLRAAESKLQDFYGPDLAHFLCAAGSIYTSSNSRYDPEVGAVAADAPASGGLTLPDGWSAAVASEVEYQVSEFAGDLNAFDLARLASGLADLSIQPSQKLQAALLKAVYMRTRTIEEKGAVDFALAKLDAQGKKSMHYDPRWTHEELKWLPRRERDKRRIIKENWYRTQWGGYSGGK